MTSAIQRLLSCAILMIWGSVLCGLYFSTRLDAYLVPIFRPLTLACGIVLVLFALLVLLAPSDENSPAGCAPAPPIWKQLLGAFVLIGPLFLALGTSKDQFGAAMVMNRNYVNHISQLPGAAPAAVRTTPDDILPGEDPSTAIGAGEAPSLPTNANGDLKVEVIDLLYAAQVPDMREEFEHRQIEVIGQLMPAKENNPRGENYDLVRMFMTCCAADIQPIALPVHPAGPPGLPDMTWVKVTGLATFPVVGGQRRPMVENAMIEQTDPPDDTYLY